MNVSIGEKTCIGTDSHWTSVVPKILHLNIEYPVASLVQNNLSSNSDIFFGKCYLKH